VECCELEYVLALVILSTCGVVLSSLELDLAPSFYSHKEGLRLHMYVLYRSR